MMIGDVILLWNERRCVYLMLGYTGLKYSSPTLASAMSNLTPAFTFIFALLFGYFIFLRTLAVSNSILTIFSSYPVI